MGVVSPERERTGPPAEPPSAPPPPPPREPRRREVPWTAITIIALILAIFVGVDRIRDALPSFDNPFASKTVDRTQPPLLASIQDIGEYRAASGNYQVVVDLEKDTKLPSELLGERTLFVAAGSVDAGVDLSALHEDAVTVSADGKGATLELPAVRLYDAEIDLGRSYVYEREEGLLNRLGNVFGGSEEYEHEALLAAERELNEAARANGDLVQAAERNTRSLLETLVRSLGFERVDVRFAS